MSDPTIKDLFRVMNDMRGGLDGLRGDVIELRGELRAAKKDLGEDIDAINARITTDKASLDAQLTAIRKEVGNLRDDLSRHSTTTYSLLDGHTARFRTIDSKLDELKDQTKSIVERLDRAHVPAE